MTSSYMNIPLPPAIFLMGPTASGKTALAVELARRLPLDIISVDSALVYRGMDIGTAKPGADILRIAPHRLIDIREPEEAYSAAEFRADALSEMAAISAQGRIPLLAGGTFLYFRALEHGLSDMPPADAAIRARLEAEALRAGWASLHARLEAIDPLTAARVHASDPQRIQRALEVYEITGRPLSDYHARGRAGPLPYRLLKLALMPADRALLGARIETRFREMLAAGFVEEVRTLLARGDPGTECPALRAVGYRQIRSYLAGEINYEAMVKQGIVATRRYAKRQLTWLRHEPGVECFPSGAAGLAERIAGRLTAWMGE
jgi:tRNA dimethylallyltransferase